MKKLLLILTLLTSGLLHAQTQIDQFGVLRLGQQAAAPANPPANSAYIYFNSSGTAVCVKSDGTSCFGGGGGSGTVTSVGLAGTANQITVTGATPITTSGSWTLSLPSTLVLPSGTTATTQSASDNSTKVATTAYVDRNSSAMVLVEQHTAAATSTLSFTTCFSSTYHNYVIKSNLLVPTTNAQNANLTFNGDSNALYDYLTLRFNSGGAAGTGATGQTSMRINAGDATLSNDAHYGLSFTYNLTDVNSLTAYKHLYGQADNAGNDGVVFQGTYKSTSAVTRFDLSPSGGGTWASGTVSCYGVTP